MIYPPFTRRPGLACFLIAAVLDVVMALRDLGGVLGGAFINPDSYMRIMRLEESLRSGSAVHMLMRDGSGAGTELYWTHFLDVALLLLSAPFMVFMDLRGALHAGGVLLGPVSTGLLGVALAWACAPFSDPRQRWMAAVMAGASVPITAYGAAGVVHHHIPVALAIVVTLGWAWRGIAGGARPGAWMGLAAACGILLTPEAMPFLLMGFGGLGVAWMMRPAERAPAAALRAAGGVFLLVLAVMLAIDPPMAGYGAAVIDRLSVVWVGLGVACLAIALALSWCDREMPRSGAMTLLGAGAAVVCLGLWLAAFPAVAKGPDGLMPKAMAEAFFGGIAEMQPISSLSDAVTFLTPGVLALGVVVLLAWRGRSVLGLYAAVCIAVAIGLALAHLRFSTYPALIGAAVLPVALSAAGGWVALRLVLLVAFISVPPAAAAIGAQHGGPDEPAHCPVAPVAALLAPYAGEVVMADPNETPELLYHTGVMTVGSLYHRNAAGFTRLRDAWRSAPDAGVPEAVRATEARLILVCPRMQRSALVRDLPRGTLRDALDAGTPPSWLRLLGKSAESGHLLYLVVG